MQDKTDYLHTKKRYLTNSIDYQVRKRENIKYKIEITKQKHERLSREIQILKKEILNLSSTANEKKFATLNNGNHFENLHNGFPSNEIKIEKEIQESNSDDVVIKSERLLIFDVKSKKKLKSTIIKLFKRIIGKKITIKKCRRLNKMNCQIKLNSHLNDNEKVILVEDNGNKIKVKLIDSSHKVLPDKCRQYYHIDFKVANEITEPVINKEDSDNNPKRNETETKDCSMIVLNPITCSNVSEENKFYISRLGNTLINEYFYLITPEPFTICPIFGDVVINRDIYDSIKPIVLESIKNKEPHTIPCIQIIPENDFNDIEKEMELSLQNMVGINQKNRNTEKSICSDKDSADVIDLTSLNNDSEPFETEQSNNQSEDTNRNILQTNTTATDSPILLSYLKSNNEHFVRTQINTSEILPSVKVREYITMESEVESRKQDKATTAYNFISLDSDEEIS